MTKWSSDSLVLALLCVVFAIACAIEFNTFPMHLQLLPVEQMLDNGSGLSREQALAVKNKLQEDVRAYTNTNAFYKNVGLFLVLFYGLLIFCLYKVQKKLKSVAEDLARTRDEALAASKIKSEFLANISHEIRTPMNAVISMSDLLLRTALADEQREYATIIHKSADSLLDLINDILDFSKIEAGKINLEIVDFDVRSVVDDTTELLSGAARARGLSISRTVAPAVPDLVRGDPRRIRQILLNLVGNGIKFTERGEVSIKVTVEKEEGDLVVLRFSVQDTGIGLDEEEGRKLFQPFTQADGSVTRKYGGTGLGLSISKRLVEVMSGRLGFESAVGSGSTFWFSLPLMVVDAPVTIADEEARVAFERAVAAEVSAPDDSEKRVEAASVGVQAALVLVAEDNSTNQKVALLLLRELGYLAHCVSNGREALAAVQENRYAILLMDCQMPEMDGFEAARAIRQWETGRGSRIPIIALTAHALPADRERCLAAGMDDYMSKPVTPARLSWMLERWLGKEWTETSDAGKQEQEAAGATSPPDVSSDPIDINLLEKTYGDKAGEELIRSFFEEVDGLLKQGATAVENRDLRTVKNVLHQLKGISATLYASELTRATKKTEEAVTSLDWGEIELAYNGVLSTYERLEKFLRENYASKWQ